jgi:hypothetical protein
VVEWKLIADDLIKNNASFEEFEQKMKNISAQASVYASPSSSPNHQEEENINMKE